MQRALVGIHRAGQVAHAAWTRFTPKLLQYGDAQLDGFLASCR